MHADPQLHALADPTRRRIFEVLAQRPSSVGELAGRMPVSRPAVSQHLRVLLDAALVTHASEGTRHVYRVDPRGLEVLRGYLDDLWRRALLDLKKVAEASYQAKQRKKEKR